MDDVTAGLATFGVLLIAGLVLGEVCARLPWVPRVVGYVVAGVIFSQDLLGGPLGLST